MTSDGTKLSLDVTIGDQSAGRDLPEPAAYVMGVGGDDGGFVPQVSLRCAMLSSFS